MISKEWYKKNKLILIIIAFLLLCMISGSIIYSLFAHRLIQAIYDGKSIGLLNTVIVSQAAHPVEYYYRIPDAIFLSYLFLLSVSMLCVLVFPRLMRSIILVRIYNLFSRLSEFCLRHKKIFFTIGGIFIFAALVSIAIFVLQNFPNSGDEYVYTYQAEIFSKGKLWNNPHPLQNFFHHIWILEKDNKLFGMYPPVWPLILSLAMLVKIPLYLVNPALGALSLIVVFLLGRKIYNEKIAVLSVFVIACSSFFLFNSASYFSHTSCSLLVLCFVYCSLNYIDTGKMRDALYAGLFFGATFLVRPYTALLSGIPVFLYFMLKNPKYYKKIPWFFLGGIPFLLFFLFYNYRLMGSALLIPWVLTEQTFLLPVNGLIFACIFALNLTMWTLLFLPVIYFVYIPAILRKPKANIIGFFPLCFILGHSLCAFYGSNQYGPRYWYEAFPFLVLFVTAKVFKEKDYSEKTNFAKFLFFLFILSLILSLPITVMHIAEERKVIWERRDLYRLVENKKIKNAVIFIKTGTGTHRPMSIGDLARNNTDFSNSVLYARDLGKDNKKLMRFYPEKNYFIYSYQKESSKGILKKYFPKDVKISR